MAKTLEDISESEIVDRLLIIVLGKSIDQLLSVPGLQSKKHEAVASSVNETFEFCELQSK